MKKELSRKEILIRINEILSFLKEETNEEKLGNYFQSLSPLERSAYIQGVIKTKLSILLADSLGLDSTHWDEEEDYSQYISNLER